MSENLESMSMDELRQGLRLQGLPGKQQQPLTAKTPPSFNLEQSLGKASVITFVLQTFGPQIWDMLGQRPQVQRTLTIGFTAISMITALTHGIKPLFNNSVGRWLSNIQLRSTDELYERLFRWIKKNHPQSTPFDASAQSAEYRKTKDSRPLWWPENHTGSKDIFYEQPGTRIFRHQGVIFLVEIVPWRSSPALVSIKSFSLTIKPIQALLEEVWLSEAHDITAKMTPVYHDAGREWVLLTSKAARPIETVDLDEEEKSKLINNIEFYLKADTKSWYDVRGIPYRRGYLFHGPPGTGKTSLSTAIAGRFGLKLYMLSMSAPHMNDQIFHSLMSQLGERCIVLLEDIDSAGLTREVAETSAAAEETENVDQEPQDGTQEAQDTKKTPKGPVNQLTLPGVLNALDSGAAPEGHIVIMSTNCPEALDEALVRVGRIDCKVAFRLAGHEMTKNIFKRMIGEKDGLDLEAKAEEFASLIPERELSPAEIQGYLLNHMGDVDMAMENVEAWVPQAIEERKKAKPIPKPAPANTATSISPYEQLLLQGINRRDLLSQNNSGSAKRGRIRRH